MAEGYVLVVDAGTSAARCFIFDRRGRIVGSRSSQWTYLEATDAPTMAREFDPEQTWADVCGLVQGSLQDAGVSGKEVAAITATSQRQGVVFLDAQGQEVYAGPNLDLRAVFEGGAIDDRMGDRVYKTTGHTPSFLLAPAKLHWFRANRPNAYDRIASVVMLADWLAFRLSGELLSEPSLAAEAGLLDVRSRQWCTELLDDLDTPGNSHIPLADAGSVAGQLNEKASRETGLPVGTPVAVSGADTQSALLGMGLVREHQMGIVAGWSVPLQMVLGSPAFSPQRQTWTGCHVVDGRWVLESSAGDAGNSYRWLADTILGGGEQAFADMDALARAVPAGSEGATAFLGPSRMNMARLGIRRGGFLFPVPLTFSETARGHLVRAALEGIAFAIRSNLQQAEETSGERASAIALGGGMTRTSTFVSILADVLGQNIGVSPTPNVSALGAYLCASTAIGEFGSLEEAAGSVAGRLKPAVPDPRVSAEYDDHYESWLRTANGLEELGG